MNAHEVHVPGLRRAWRHEAKQEPDHDAVVLHDSRERSELVKEDGVRERAGWTPPPAVNYLHDVVVVLFAEGAGDHFCADATPLQRPSKERVFA